MAELLSITPLAKLLNVQPNQVYMWYQRRFNNGFPSSRGFVTVKQRPVPAFNPEEVKAWYDQYKFKGRHRPRKKGVRERNASGVGDHGHEGRQRRVSPLAGDRERGGSRRIGGQEPVEADPETQDVAGRVQVAVGVPEHEPRGAGDCEHLAAGRCPWCCPSCNWERHSCGGCGTSLNHQGLLPNGTEHDCDQISLDRRYDRLKPESIRDRHLNSGGYL